MRSLRGRLILWLLAGTGLLVILAVLFLDRTISSRLRQDFDADLLAEARSVMAATEQEDARVVLELDPGLLPEMEAARNPDYFQIWLADGRVLARSRSLADRSLARPAPTSRTFRFDDLTLPDGRPGRRVEITFLPSVELEVKQPPEGQPSSHGSVYVTLAVATGRESLDAFLASLHRTLAVALLVLLLGSTALVWSVTTYTLRPLNDLNRRLEAIDAGSLRKAVVIDGAPAELVPTIEHLNGLLARLAKSFERERMFSANLAHELRTPLAELRAVTDVALRWPDDTASLVAALGEARSSGLQMEKIVVNLLALARYDGGQHTLHLSRVPLRETIEGCWKTAEAEAEGRGLTASLEIPKGLSLVTDKEKLELILSNLLANAVAHGSPGGRITCAASAAAGRFELSVSNPATDLTADDLPRIFDRFWRRDAARSDGRHAGLGLSLVAALCETLGFSREARLHDGVFEIVLSGPQGDPEAATAATAIPKGEAFLPVSS